MKQRYNVTIKRVSESFLFRNIIEIWHDEKLLFSVEDYGEPEDNSFLRDYSWVAPALEKAYQLGFQDASPKGTYL